MARRTQALFEEPSERKPSRPRKRAERGSMESPVAARGAPPEAPPTPHAGSLIRHGSLGSEAHARGETIKSQWKKVGARRGGAKGIWFQGKWLLQAGFSPGDMVAVQYDKDAGTITIAINEAGERLLTVSQRDGVPIIDVSNVDVADVVGSTEMVHFETVYGRITITREESAIMVAERTRERNNLEGSVFSGAGFLTLAAEQAGYVPTTAVEIDPVCAAVYQTNHPSASLYGNVLDLTAKIARGRVSLPHVDLVTAGIPCFAKGTMILTRSGYAAIETVVVGDEVLTHLGRWRRVTAVMKRRAKTRLKIKAQGCHDLVTTPEHPFWARRPYVRIKGGRKIVDAGTVVGGRLFQAAEWIEAGELSGGHWVSQVLPIHSDSDNHSTAFWKLVGRYLADGWLVNRGDRKDSGVVVICCDHTERAELADIINKAGFSASVVKDRTATKFHIHRKGLWSFLKQFGHLAHGKKIPGFVLELDADKATALLDGYIGGDGHSAITVTSSGRRIQHRRTTSVSKALTLGIALLVQRLGIVASIGFNRPEKTKVIEGRLCRQRPWWSVIIQEHNRSAFVEDMYGWKLVKSVKRVRGGDVYNLSVDQDESYVAENTVVHNCQNYSVITRGAAADREANVLDAMTHAYINIAMAQNPFNIVIEQVKDYVKTETFRGLVSFLTFLGYQVQYAVLDANDFDLPTGRERAVIVATTLPASGLLERVASSFQRIIPPTAGDILLPPSAVERLHSCQGGWFTVRTQEELDAMPREVLREEESASGWKARPGHWLGKEWARSHHPPQFITYDTKRIPAIVKGYAKPTQTGPFVKHPDRPNTYRLLTVEEIKRCHGVPDDYRLTGDYKTDVELLGQGVVVDVFRAVIEALPGGSRVKRNPDDAFSAGVTSMLRAVGG